MALFRERCCERLQAVARQRGASATNKQPLSLVRLLDEPVRPLKDAPSPLQTTAALSRAFYEHKSRVVKETPHLPRLGGSANTTVALLLTIFFFFLASPLSPCSRLHRDIHLEFVFYRFPGATLFRLGGA